MTTSKYCCQIAADGIGVVAMVGDRLGEVSVRGVNQAWRHRSVGCVRSVGRVVRWGFAQAVNLAGAATKQDADALHEAPLCASR